MSISAVFWQVALLSAMILLGYFLSRSGYFQKEHSDFITRLLLDVCIPCIVLAAGSTDTGGMSPAFTITILLVFVAAMYVFLLVGRALGRLVGLSPDETLVLSRNAGYPNNGFMGLPLASSVFGAPGTIWCAITMVSGNIYLFSMVLQSFSAKARKAEGEKPGLASTLKSLATPLNISTLIMFVMLFTGLRLPGFVQGFCDSMGACTTPLAMLVVGNLLSRSPLLETLLRPALYLSTFLRNLAAPLTFAVLLRFLGWERELCLCLVMLMGCSVASMISIAANRYDRAPGFASQSLLQSNLFLPLTLPLVMALADKIL